MVQQELGLCYHSSDILPPHIVGWTIILFPGNIHPTTAQHLPLYVSGVLHHYPKKMLSFYIKKMHSLSSETKYHQNIMNYLFLSQIGSNAVYILFVAQNILPVGLGRHLISDDDCTNLHYYLHESTHGSFCLNIRQQPLP